MVTSKSGTKNRSSVRSFNRNNASKQLSRYHKPVERYLKQGFVLNGVWETKAKAIQIKEEQLGNRFYTRIVKNKVTGGYYLLQKRKPKEVLTNQKKKKEERRKRRNNNG